MRTPVQIGAYSGAGLPGLKSDRIDSPIEARLDA